MARRLSDDMAAELAGNQLDDVQFAEWLIYHGADGTVSRIKGIVNRNADFETEGPRSSLRTSITLLVSNDPAGGIAAPALGDWIERLEENGRRYNFSGRLVSEDAVSFRLEYQSALIAKTGNAGSR